MELLETTPLVILLPEEHRYAVMDKDDVKIAGRSKAMVAFLPNYVLVQFLLRFGE